MKIENIRIDGFGVWTDKRWEGLSPGLNVFHGPNETGKSTLTAFVRAMLFGFDRRGSARRYEPLNGGAHGGWLDLRLQDRSVRIKQKPGRHVRGTAAVYDGDTVGGEELLDRLLNGTTRTLYHNVFAFGLEELEHFHTLQESEVAQHITGAGLGIGAARWTSVQRDIEERQKALFLPRGHTSSINLALKELEGVREELDRTEHQPEDYWAAHEMKTRLSARVAGLEEAVTELKNRAGHYEKRLKSRPLWERRRKIEERLQELTVVDAFPEGGIERLDLMRRQRQTLEIECAHLQRELENRRLRRIELSSWSDPEDYARRVQVVESLRTLGPRVDAVRRVHSAAIDGRNTILQERKGLESALENLRPPSTAAFLLFLGLIWIGAAGLSATGHECFAAATILVSLSFLFWYRRRIATVTLLAGQVEACVARLNTSALDIQKVEREARQIEAEIRDLTGNSEITPHDIDVRVTELERISKLSDEIRRLDESAERAGEELQRVSNQIDELGKGIQSLLAEAAASSEEEFAIRSGIYKQRQLLIGELERIPVDVPEPGLLFDVRASEEEAYELACRELRDMEQQLIDARHESGRIEERIALMERSEERSRALGRQEVILAKIDDSAELWAVLTLCRTLLDETRKIYETDRQPEVLRQASLFFKVMTQGAYPRVISPLEGSDILVERADGVRLAPQLLSRGTAEQLYLAMRLALVREYARHVEPLPVVLDDIFVNFDPQRTRNTAQAVRELSETHQVLIFTCHPHIVDHFQDIAPAVKIFSLQ